MALSARPGVPAPSVSRTPSGSPWWIVFVAAIVALACLALTTLTAVPASSVTAPTINVSDEVRAGKSVKVTGRNFPKNARGNLTYRGKVVGGFTTSTRGAFEKMWTTPKNVGTGMLVAKAASRSAKKPVKIISATPPPEETTAPEETTTPPEETTPEHTHPEETTPEDPNVHLWSDADTWGGSVPKSGDEVTIPAGKTVLLDRSTPYLDGLTVNGTLRFDDDDITLTSDWISVHGTMEIGTEEDPLTTRTKVVLTRLDENQNVMNMGTKFIGVMGGKLEVHGKTDVGSWTKLSATAQKGAKEITLANNPGWKAGDRIAIASTDYDPGQAEEATIASVSGNTLNLTRALNYSHWGVNQTYAGQTVDERAEVALLNRNVTIEGEEDSSADGFGGQIMVMNGGQLHMDGAELRRMGQQNILRRYPVHFHMLGDDGRDSYIRDTTIHHTFNRCMTIHGTNYLNISKNVCYQNIGHAYFMEDGAEHDNVFEGNLGFSTVRPPEGERLLPSDGSPATFWITNPDNVFRNNVAAGSENFGFWYALPKHPTGLFSTQFPEATANTWPRRTPLGVFSGNVAHSNDETGLHVDDGPRPDGDTETTYYDPRNDPTPPGDDEPDSASVEATFEGFTAYKNRWRAVWLRGENHVLEGAVLADNAIGATFASHESYLEDSLVVGETQNKGNPPEWETKGLDGRSLARPWWSDFPIRGYEFYDGKVGAKGTTFVNFQPNSQRGASGVGVLLDDHFDLHPGNLATGLDFVNAKKVYLPGPEPGADGDKSTVINDLDGSLTGTPGKVVTANNQFLTKDGCTLESGWNAYVCPPGTKHATLFAGLDEGGNPDSIKPLRITRADGKVQTLNGCCDDSTYALTSIFTDQQYTVGYNGGTPDRLRFVLMRADLRKDIVLKIPYSKTPKVTKWGCDVASSDWCGGGKATSVADLESKDRSGYYYDTSARMLYLRLYAFSRYEPSETVEYEELRVEPK